MCACVYVCVCVSPVYLHVSTCTQVSKKCTKQMQTVRKHESDSPLCDRKPIDLTVIQLTWRFCCQQRKPLLSPVSYACSQTRTLAAWKLAIGEYAVLHACGHMILFTASNKFSFAYGTSVDYCVHVHALSLIHI